jgi:putative resolvase
VGNLERRVARLNRWVQSAGMPVVRIETEVGSGMNGASSKTRRLLADPKVTIVVIENSDPLARMNAALVEAALAAHGRRLVADGGEVTDDLVRDMVEALTSVCIRLYGQRPARNRTLKALRCTLPNVGLSGR